MKTTFSKFLGLAAVVAGLLLAGPHASAYDLLTSSILANGATNTVAIGGTNAIVNVVPASFANPYDIPSNAHNTNNFPAVEFVTGGPSGGSGHRFVSVQLSFTSSAANTANVTVWMANSVDRANWTTNAFVFATAATGTTQKTIITNLDTYCIPYWCVYAVSNAAASALVTNLSINIAGVKGI